jgi:hypothetical protein
MSTFDVKFTARDFEMMREEILRFIRETNPTAWSDFAESGLGTVLVEMAALVGEIASFGQDQVAQELLWLTYLQSKGYFYLTPTWPNGSPIMQEGFLVFRLD